MADWAAWKPILTVFALPPVPFLVLIMVGARMILPRRGLGYLILLTGVAGIWLSSCIVVGRYLQDQVLKPPGPLLGPEQARLESAGRAYAQRLPVSRRAGRAAGPEAIPPAAIMVLGGGREPLARELGVSDLSAGSLKRLRYGVWLSRRTGLPLGFSGGVGWAQQANDAGVAEAQVAARIAEQEFNLPLRWIEAASSDTRANADRSVPMLAEQGIAEIVLVTDAYHMPRAVRAFKEAAMRTAISHKEWPIVRITPAPMDYWSAGERSLLDWLPSVDGMRNVQRALREWLGMLMGS